MNQSEDLCSARVFAVDKNDGGIGICDNEASKFINRKRPMGVISHYSGPHD